SFTDFSTAGARPASATPRSSERSSGCGGNGGSRAQGGQRPTRTQAVRYDDRVRRAHAVNRGGGDRDAWAKALPPVIGHAANAFTAPLPTYRVRCHASSRRSPPRYEGAAYCANP